MTETRHDHLLIASWNIHKCVGSDGRFDPVRTAEVIGEIGADIIALQEVDTRFGIRRGLLDLDHLARAHGLVPVPLPGLHSGRSPAHGWHGNIILHRIQGRTGGAMARVSHVSHVEVADLPGLEPRGALVAEFRFDGQKGLRVIAAHLGLLRGSRRRQAEKLAELAGSGPDLPTILLGDFNEWRLGKPSGLHGLATRFADGGAVASFPARLPVLALDRIMASRPGLVGPVSVHVSAAARLASDHLPVKAHLNLNAAW